MNYELALKLKNAGFPQIQGIYGFFRGEMQDIDVRLSRGHEYKGYELSHSKNIAYFPSLNELIEACEKFPRQFSLYGRDKDRWEATSVGAIQLRGAMLDPSITEYGFSPEEAIANLWLELNKK